MELIFIMRRVLGLLHYEIAKAWPAHALIELARNIENAVAHGFGLQLAAVHAPEKPVVGIQFGQRGIVVGGLAVSGARDDFAMQHFKGLATITEILREPVQQLGMCW